MIRDPNIEPSRLARFTDDSESVASQIVVRAEVDVLEQV